MKRSAIGCSKMLDLMEALDVPQYVAVGILESLWHFTAKEAPQGNIGKIEDRKIARAIGWQGEAAKLIDGLVVARWVDRCPQHRLIVHDWHEHCEDSVKKNLKRNGLDFVRPCPGHVQTNGGHGSPTSNHVVPALPCLSLALPKPEPQPDAHTQPLEELPERLRTESFRDAWTAWEQYRKQSDWGCVQPISRVQVWKKLETLGANEAENRVRTAVAKGYRNIVDDAVLSIPNGKAKGPEPPKRTYKDSTALRIAAEKRCAELEQSGMEPEDMIESLVKEFGHDLPSTIRSKLTKQINSTGKPEKAK